MLFFCQAPAEKDRRQIIFSPAEMLQRTLVPSFFYLFSSSPFFVFSLFTCLYWAYLCVLISCDLLSSGHEGVCVRVWVGGCGCAQVCTDVIVCGHAWVCTSVTTVRTNVVVRSPQPH